MTVCYLFPGQGSQEVGMAQAFTETNPAAADLFREADSRLGRSLSGLCFHGPEEDLRRTENTQPAILAASIACLSASLEALPPPDYLAGHSLGEYSAHVAAGSIALGDALWIVKERGRLMQEAVPEGAGAMAAVIGLDAASLAPLLTKAEAETGAVVAIANRNSPQQTVIAGSKAAVDCAMALAKEAGARRVVLLPVSAPFHCSLMEPAEHGLAPLLDALAMQDPAVPVVTNVDAVAVRAAEDGRGALKRQVTAPVRFAESIEFLHREGVRTFIEIGPGRVLSGLVRRMLPREGLLVLGVSDPDSLAKARERLA